MIRGYKRSSVICSRDWLAVSQQVAPQGERLRAQYGDAEGLDVLKENIREARSILIPDDEFFDPDKLASLRDEAIEAHRSGFTEPLLGNERVH